jgi:hypothetical protein
MPARAAASPTGAEVWVPVAGDELVIVADVNALPLRPGWAPAPPTGLVEGRPPRAVGAGAPADRPGALPRPPAGPVPGTAPADTQAHQRGRDGVPRARSRSGGVTAGRFAEDDLLAIVRHRAAGAPSAELVVADETHSAQPGTSAWEGFGR